MIRFQVTDNCINNGSIISANSCPVSLAIREKLPMAEVSVGFAGIKINDKTFPLPKSVEKFVPLYDAGIAVEPFSFVLDI